MSNYYFEVGTWDKYYSNIKEMVASHQAIVNLPDMPEFAPNEDMYGALGASGLNSVIALIDKSTNKIRGYASATIFAHPHYANHRFAVIDAFFVDPEYRVNRRAGKDLMEVTQQFLLEVKDIDFIQMDTSVNMDIGNWLKRDGFNPLSTIYIKRLR